MIEKKFAPNINLFERIQPTKLNTGTGVAPMRMGRIEKPETSDFSAVFSGLIENLNHEMNAPDELLKDAMQEKAISSVLFPRFARNMIWMKSLSKLL